MIDMKAEETTMVSITLNQYKHFVQTETALILLMDSIYDGACLSYNKKSLSFDDSTLETLMRIMDRDRYMKVFEALKGADDGTGKN